MPIFDDVKGFVPLPKSQTEERDSVPGLGDLQYTEDPTLASEIPIPLPKAFGIGINTSDTIVDRVFTKINDVFEYIHLPTPDAIVDLYKTSQRIEGVIADPLSAGKQFLENTIYDALHPSSKIDGGVLPRDANTYSKKVNVEDPLLPSDDNDYEKLMKRGTGAKRPTPGEKYISELSGIEWDQMKDSTSETQYLYHQGEGGNEEVEFEFQGRKTVGDLTMRLNHLWDLKIEPYHHKGIDRGVVPPMLSSTDYKMNQTPYYTGALQLNNYVYQKLTDYVPVLAYDLDMKMLNSKELELFSGSSIAVPEVIRYNSNMNLQILDDENKRWRRWFQTYSENMYNEKYSTVTPYKNSCLQITIYQYRSDWKVLSKQILLCTLRNYNMKSDGAGIGSPDILDISLSVVGAIELPESESILNII